jgi:hypothetical protein
MEGPGGAADAGRWVGAARPAAVVDFVCSCTAKIRITPPAEL